MKNLYNTNFAFEVDLEKREGKFLFDTGEKDQSLAEQKILERCSYKNILVAECVNEQKYLEIDSSEVLGLTIKDAILPMGDTITTILETDKGFICQVNPNLWGESIHQGNKIFVLTMADKYSIDVVNSFLDI